jgi:hypothetical protein
MKDFLKKYTAWILLGLLIGYGLVLLGTTLATDTSFEFFNEKKVVCFQGTKPTCYQVISLTLTK